MNRILSLCVCVLLAACTASPTAAPGEHSSSPSSSSSVAISPDVIVDSPAPNALVHSPINITGRARGTWYFEASFPVRLFDSQGRELAVGHAEAEGDWMTEQYVPFTAQLHYRTNAEAGTLVLEKDNPSGLPENDASVQVPVLFR